MFIIIPGAFNAQTGVPGGSQQGQIVTVGSILKVTERDRRPYPTDVGTPSEIWIDNTAGIGYICKEFDTGHGTVWDRLDLLGDFVTFGDSDPGVNIDIKLGYRPGSLRYARNSEILWICKDNTQGAAVWDVVSGGGGVVSVNGLTGVVQLYLDDILDVDAATPNDGDVLTWDSTTSTWIALAPTGGGGTYTVDNGLTESPANNFQLGGTLIQNTTITETNYQLLFNAENKNSLLLNSKYTSNNTTEPVLNIFRSVLGGTGNSGADNIGSSIVFKNESKPGVVSQPLVSDLILASVVTDATPQLLRQTQFEVLVNYQNSLIKVITASRNLTRIDGRITELGATTHTDIQSQFILSSYGLGAYTGTLAYTLGVDASGNVIEFTGGGSSPLTTKGDLYTFSTVDTRLPVGTDNQILTADSSTATGLKWSTVTSGGGLLHGTTSGTDTYTVTITGATAYADGDAYLIRFAIGNTTSATLNISNGISSFGAIPLYRNNDGPLLGGDVLAGGEMICVYNSTLNIFQCIGVSPNSLIAYVTNDDSVTITKGQPVYAFSGTGDRMTVKLAYNTGDSTSAQTVGLVLSTSIAANQKGLIMMQGLLDGLSNVKPANGWADGSPVYLGTTAGSITPTKQYAPNHLVYLGFVTTASPGAAGRIYVRVQNGFELDELHNVQAQTPALKDTLWYDNTVSPAQWKVAQASTLLPTSYGIGSFGVTVDGVSSVIQVGQTGFVTMPYDGTITGWSITTNASGSIQFDVWKDALIDTIPTVADSIVGGVYPTLTTAQLATSTSVGSWTTAFSAGHVFGFYVNSVSSTVRNATLTIRCTKT